MGKLSIESDSPELTVLVFDGTDYDAMQKYKRMMSAEDAYSCLFDIEQKCREWAKYPPDSWSTEKCDMAYDLREKIIEIMNEYKLEEY